MKTVIITIAMLLIAATSQAGEIRIAWKIGNDAFYYADEWNVYKVMPDMSLTPINARIRVMHEYPSSSIVAYVDNSILDSGAASFVLRVTYADDIMVYSEPYEYDIHKKPEFYHISVAVDK